MVRINLYTIKQVKESGALYGLDSKFIKEPKDIYNVVQTVLQLQDEANEKFGILSLNTRNAVIGVHILSQGSINSSIVHPREVFKAAILNNAAYIVCFHNHPSGNPAPSSEDLELSHRLIAAGELIGIEVLDHIIVGDNCYISLKEQGFI